MSIFQKTQTLTFDIRWQGRDWRKERLLAHTPCSVIYLNDFEFSEGFFYNIFLKQKVAYPHPRDCSKYYVCDVNGTVSWKKIATRSSSS